MAYVYIVCVCCCSMRTDYTILNDDLVEPHNFVEIKWRWDSGDDDDDDNKNDNNDLKLIYTYSWQSTFELHVLHEWSSESFFVQKN